MELVILCLLLAVGLILAFIAYFTERQLPSVAAGGLLLLLGVNLLVSIQAGTGVTWQDGSINYTYTNLTSGTLSHSCSEKNESWTESWNETAESNAGECIGTITEVVTRNSEMALSSETRVSKTWNDTYTLGFALVLCLAGVGVFAAVITRTPDDTE